MGLICTMVRLLIRQSILCSALILLSGIVLQPAAQNACPYSFENAGDISSVVVVKQTIHIITDVPYDTTLEINKDLTVTVDNAPTHLDLITTYLSQSAIPKGTDR